MCRKLSIIILPLVVIMLSSACAQQRKPKNAQTVQQPVKNIAMEVFTPDSIYGELFDQVQMQRIFPDGKTFVDCTPKRPVRDIMYDYGLQKGPGMDLQKFVSDNFELPPAPPAIHYIQQEKDVVAHIKNLWGALKRQPDTVVEGSSLLPLPHPYIVPGGRFREIYYWDSYFTMLGLKESDEAATIRNMVDNFAHLINAYGHIPNGNRTYYVSRSQPPFFSLMVELLAGIDGDSIYQHYLPALAKEYAYWSNNSTLPEMEGADKSVVRLKGEEVLNRYWDLSPTARQESYREDVLTADSYATGKLATMRFVSNEAMEEMRQELKAAAYHHLRAGAASGWDFSSRWFEDKQNIFTIRTSDIIPVDLNALLYHLESTLAKTHQLAGNQGLSTGFSKKASRRAHLINQYCWNAALGYYTDYNWVTGEQMDMITPAGMFPFCLLPSDMLKDKIASATSQLEKHLVKPGGIVTTTIHSHEQWDAPNGWAPLQWMTIWAMERNGQQALAEDIARRWIRLNTDVYHRTGKLMEKYNVEDLSLDAGGGEYPAQDGFGWTNGVLLALIKKYGPQ